MKRTDQERLARELGRSEKKLRIAEKRNAGQDPESAGSYSKRLAGLLMSDGQQIYNIDNDEEVLEILMEMRENLSDKEMTVACRKAIKSTKVPDVETPLDEMMALVAD